MVESLVLGMAGDVASAPSPLAMVRTLALELATFVHEMVNKCGNGRFSQDAGCDRSDRAEKINTLFRS